MLFHVHPRVSMVDEPESMSCHGQAGWWQAANASCMSYSSYVMAASSSLSLLIRPMGLRHVFHSEFDCL